LHPSWSKEKIGLRYFKIQGTYFKIQGTNFWPCQKPEKLQVTGTVFTPVMKVKKAVTRIKYPKNPRN
jgi:hypothetical protein